MPEPVSRVSWSDRRHGAEAGAFFGMVGGFIHLGIALVTGLAGWWHDSAATIGQFAVAQLAYAGIVVAGGALLGSLWDLRASRAGRWMLWLIGAAVVSGAIVSLRKGAVWRWDLATWGWLLIMTPAFAWVLGSGRKTSDRTAAS